MTNAQHEGGGRPGRPRKNPYNVPTAPPPEGDESIVEKEEDALQTILAAFNDARGESTFVISVYQVIPVPGRAAREPWLFDAEVTELEGLRQRLAQDYGGGRYRCRVKKNNLAFKQYDLEIALRPGARSPAAPQPQAPQESAPPALVAALERQSALIESLIARMATQAPAPAASPWAGMTEMLAALKAMDALRPPANIGLDMFKQGIELAKSLTGGDRETGVLDLVKEIFSQPQIVEALGRAVNPAPVAAYPQPEPQALPMTAPPMPQAPQPAAQFPAPQPAAQAQDEKQQIAAKISSVMQELLAKAQAGADPALYADYVLETMPPQLLDMLEATPDPLAALETYFPAIAPHKEWFAALMEKLYEGEDPESAP